MREMVRQLAGLGQMGSVVQAAYVLQISVLANCGLPFLSVNVA